MPFKYPYFMMKAHALLALALEKDPTLLESFYSREWRARDAYEVRERLFLDYQLTEDDKRVLLYLAERELFCPRSIAQLQDIADRLGVEDNVTTCEYLDNLYELGLVDCVGLDDLGFSLSDASRPAYGIDPDFASREARLREENRDYPYRLISMSVSINDGVWTFDTLEHGRIELGVCHSVDGKVIGVSVL